MLEKEVIKEKLSKIKFGKKHDLSDILMNLIKYVEQTEAEKDAAYDRLREFNKDQEIIKLRQRLENLHKNAIGIIGEKEQKIASDFWKKHAEKCNSELGCSYIVTPTGIGTYIVIKCNKCKEEKDISDYDVW